MFEQYKLAIFGGIILILCIGSAYMGYSYEHKDFLLFQQQVKEQGDKQNAESKQKDAEHLVALQEAQTNATTAVTSIDAYYKSHPVVKLTSVPNNTCSSIVSKTVSDSRHPYGITSDYYASAYSPEDTELVAARLDELQKLLINDGVEIK